MTTAQVIEIGPGNAAQMLHRDLENWFPFIAMGPAGPEVTVNFLIALTDFTEENGATRVIPACFRRWAPQISAGTITAGSSAISSSAALMRYARPCLPENPRRRTPIILRP